MTQKDIAFVADFLSEHFNEVRSATNAPGIVVEPFIDLSLLWQNEELFDRKGKYFNVERVGQVSFVFGEVSCLVWNSAAVVLQYSGFSLFQRFQYLKDEDEDLVSPPSTCGNQWLQFLHESTHLKGKPPPSRSALTLYVL